MLFQKNLTWKVIEIIYLFYIAKSREVALSSLVVEFVTTADIFVFKLVLFTNLATSVFYFIFPSSRKKSKFEKLVRVK